MKWTQYACHKVMQRIEKKKKYSGYILPRSSILVWSELLPARDFSFSLPFFFFFFFVLCIIDHVSTRQQHCTRKPPGSTSILNCRKWLSTYIAEETNLECKRLTLVLPFDPTDTATDTTDFAHRSIQGAKPP